MLVHERTKCVQLNVCLTVESSSMANPAVPTKPGSLVHLKSLPVALVLGCCLLQVVAWQAGWRQGDIEQAAMYLGMAEMAFMLFLLLNGWRIQQHMQAVHAGAMATQTARWGLVSLALCTLGDLVNRNFGQQYFAYDQVIEHSYLADSVWFFLPGYLVWVVLAWKVAATRVNWRIRLLTLLLAAMAGLTSWYTLVLPGTSAYVMGITGAYSLVITAMAAAGGWMLMANGRVAWLVATGAVSATVADALIAQFWLFGHGHYPGIAHLNFALYFASQALLQQLPWALTQPNGQVCRTDPASSN